jgi:hypothetical protein
MHLKSILASIALTLVALPAAAQNFSCGYGDRGACLGYGDTVCSSSGKCVGQDAQCFNRYQCDYEGFSCQSNVTDCVAESDTLLRTHNTLVDDYNTLLAGRNRLQTDLEDAQRCLIYATTLAEARFCAP